MIEADVLRVVISRDNELIVLLKGRQDDRVLPIHVDAGQAHAIGLQLEGLTFPRPLTHDLLKTIIGELGGRLVRIEVCDLVDGTFYARLVILRGEKEIAIDARPSDAIAIALRCSAPVFIDEEVMNKAGVIIQGDEKDEKKARKLSPSEILEQKLAKAIEEERYEDAASLRDELKRYKENKTSN